MAEGCALHHTGVSSTLGQIQWGWGCAMDCRTFTKQAPRPGFNPPALHKSGVEVHMDKLQHSQETEARIQSHPQLHSELESSLCCMDRWESEPSLNLLCGFMALGSEIHKQWLGGMLRACLEERAGSHSQLTAAHHPCCTQWVPPLAAHSGCPTHAAHSGRPILLSSSLVPSTWVKHAQAESRKLGKFLTVYFKTRSYYVTQASLFRDTAHKI